MIFIQAVSGSSTQSVKVTPSIGNPIAATISGSDFALAANTCVSGAATCSLSVIFTPSRVETVTGTLTLTDSVLRLSTTVALTGTMTLPTIAPTVNTSTLAFPAATVGTRTSLLPILVTSPNQDPIAAAVTDGASDFTLPQATTCTVNSTICQIPVLFTPSASGQRTGTVVLKDTLTGLSTPVSLTGTGIAIVAPPIPVAPILTSASLSFATTTAGSTSPVQTIVAASYNLDTLTAAFATAGPFRIVSSPTCTKAANCPFRVVFNPTAAGSFTGTLLITDGVTGLSSTAAVSGVATAAQSSAAFSTGSQAFNATAVGSTSTVAPLTLSNVGTTPFTITAVSILGDQAGDFSDTTNCIGPLAVGATCSISVSFAPTAAGTRTANLTLTIDGLSTHPTVTLTGIGTSVALNVLVPGANADIAFTEGSGVVAHDSSGHGNDCVFASGINSPTWNGSGLQLNNGTDQNAKYCVLPASSSNTDSSVMNSRTLTMCSYVNPYSNGYIPGLSIPFGGSTRDDIGALMLSGAGSTRATGYLGVYYGFGGEPSWTNDALIGYHCFTYALGSATDHTVDHLYIDGVEAANQGNTYTAWDRRQPGDFYWVGGLPWDPGSWLWGTVNYILAYPQQLSAADVAHNSIILHDSAFYNRNIGSPPVQSSSSNNVLVVDGDSITAGPPNTIRYSDQLTLNTPFKVTNTAVGGKLLMTTVADTPLLDLPLYSPNSKFAFASNEAGINDLIIAGRTGAQVLADRTKEYAAYKAAGFTVIATTMLSSGQGTDPTIETINDGLRKLAASAGYPLVDWANEPCLGAQGSYANTSTCNLFSGDNLHPNMAGETEMAAFYSNVVNYLTGATQSAPTVVTAASYTLAPPDRFLTAQGTGNQALSLPSCYGWSVTTPFTLLNNNTTGTVSVAPTGGFLLNGDTLPVAIPAGTSLQIYADIVSQTASGCAWHTR